MSERKIYITDFLEIAKKKQGVAVLTNDVLQSPIFPQEFSPNFAELLLLAFIATNKNVPESVLAVAAPEGGSKSVDIGLVVTQTWNQVPEDSRSVKIGEVIKSLVESISKNEIQGQDSNSREKRDSLELGLQTYENELAYVINSTP